jgi:hypothetical protein
MEPWKTQAIEDWKMQVEIRRMCKWRMGGWLFCPILQLFKLPDIQIYNGPSLQISPLKFFTFTYFLISRGFETHQEPGLKQISRTSRKAGVIGNPVEIVDWIHLETWGVKHKFVGRSDWDNWKLDMQIIGGSEDWDNWGFEPVDSENVQ